MRTLLILPGYSTRNREWGEAAAEYFGKDFDQVVMHTYKHWETGAEMDFDAEQVRITTELSDLSEQGALTVMAKSVGSLLAFLSVAKRVVVPERCVFFGIPFDLASTGVFAEDWSPVESFRVPSLAFHNEHDPTVSHDFAKEVVATKCPSITFITTEGADHSYLEFSVYAERIIPFLENK